MTPSTSEPFRHLSQRQGLGQAECLGGDLRSRCMRQSVVMMAELGALPRGLRGNQKKESF